MRKCRFCAKEISPASVVCEHCGQELIPGRAAARAAAPVTPPAPMPVVRCKVCDVGALARKRVHRLSAMVVLIGYILLVPSVLGMLFAVMTLVSASTASARTSEHLRETTTEALRANAIPQPIIDKVVEARPIASSELQGLTIAQRARIESAQSSLPFGTAGAGFGGAFVGGLAIIFFVVSLVGGLLGWLLVMKKDVLQCSNCGAVTAAS